MGLLARLVMFPSVELKYKALRVLDGCVDKLREYGYVHLYNRKYSLDKGIPLLFRVRKQVIIRDDVLGDFYYYFDIDVPAEHDSLDGRWNVKEMKHASLYSYVVDGIENFMVIISDGRRAVKGVYNALSSLNISVFDVRVEVPKGPEALEVFRDIGEIHWTYISNIRDPHLRDAGLWGKRLQDSEVVEDFLERGGVIKAIIVQDESRNLRLILGSKGSIYSQRNIPPTQFAREISKLIGKLKELKLLKINMVS